MDKCNNCRHNSHYELSFHKWQAVCNSCGRYTQEHPNKVGAWIQWNKIQRGFINYDTLHVDQDVPEISFRESEGIFEEHE